MKSAKARKRKKPAIYLVSNRQDRTIRKGWSDHLLDDLVRFLVDRCRRFIQNQDLWLSKRRYVNKSEEIPILVKNYLPLICAEWLGQDKTAVFVPPRNCRLLRRLRYPIYEAELQQHPLVELFQGLPITCDHHSSDWTDPNCIESSLFFFFLQMRIKDKLLIRSDRWIPSNSIGNWGMMDRWDRRSANPSDWMSISSIITLPDWGSTILYKACMIELFPAPVLPHIPI